VAVLDVKNNSPTFTNLAYESSIFVIQLYAQDADVIDRGRLVSDLVPKIDSID